MNEQQAAERAHRSLVVAIAAAAEYASKENPTAAVRVTSLTAALMAEHMIERGWPAALPVRVPIEFFRPCDRGPCVLPKGHDGGCVGR